MVNGQVVVDTSLALKWALMEPYTAEARALLAGWEDRRVVRLVPSWFACEVANALHQRTRRGDLSLDRVKLVLVALQSQVTVRDFEPRLASRALELAAQLRQGATYDAHYLALAELSGCVLWTADQRFWLAARSSSSRVRWVEEK